MALNFRRVVTGHDEQGNAIVMYDSDAPNVRAGRPGQSACVVSHLQVTRSLLSEALGVPTAQMTTLPVATASVTCIDYDGEGGDSNSQEKKITVHFQSFKPEAGLAKAVDGAN